MSTHQPTAKQIETHAARRARERYALADKLDEMIGYTVCYRGYCLEPEEEDFLSEAALALVRIQRLLRKKREA